MIKLFALFVVILFGITEITLRQIHRNDYIFFKYIWDEKYRLYRLESNREGIFHKGVVTGKVHINNEGWNNAQDYIASRQPKVPRIVILGSCSVTGREVHFDSIFAAIVQTSLSKKGVKAEVYSFGASVANIVQALHMSRYVVDKYSPDILIVAAPWEVIYPGYGYFLSISRIGDNIYETQPRPYDPTKMFGDDLLNRGLLGRSYLYYLLKKTYNGDYYIRKLFGASRQYSYMDSCSTKYLLDQFKRLSCTTYFMVDNYLVVDGMSFNLLQNKYLKEQNNNSKLLSTMIRHYGFRTINMSDIYISNHQIHGYRYDFYQDGHMNAIAHKVVGLAVFDTLIKYESKKLYIH